MRDRPPPPLMQLQQVSLAASVGSSYLLQNISCSVFRGDRVGIIGPSGAGKTSLLRLLNRLSEPTQGSIELNGQQLSQIPAVSLRSQIVLVPQEPKLLGMGVKEALTYPLLLQKLPKSEIVTRLDTWITRLNIPEAWLERHELQLSLGQRQLVAIARALMMHPKILLLDEPTSALDAGQASHLLQLLIELADSQKTVLMANHQLDQIQQFATRILYLENGQLVKDASAPELDWLNLRQKIIQVEEQAAQEWL